MNGLEIYAFIVTPIVAALFGWAVSSYALWDLKRSRLARMNAELKQG